MDWSMLPKEKPRCWTSRRVFAQVTHGSNIQLLPYSLVVQATKDTAATRAHRPHLVGMQRRGYTKA